MIPAPAGRGRADREDPETDMAVHDDDPIGGRYQRLESIGRGSFGEVWRVWDPQRREELAVKILLPRHDDAADPDAAEEDRQRFLREARETWKFRGRHNIVLVYDFGEHRGRPFLVMELMRGETLQQMLRREVRLAPPRALEILQSVANAIGEAHLRRLVHRDVKPANIFVGAGDEVTLLDFGMLGALDAGRLSQLTESGGFGGTLEYMAPERFPGDDGSPPEAPSQPPGDIYSLACVFHQCLTGEVFFDGDVYEVRRKHRHGPRPQPGIVDPALAQFNEIVARGLAVDPAVRPQSAAELVAGVQNALKAWRASNDAEVRTGTTTPLVPTGAPGTRRPPVDDPVTTQQPPNGRPPSGPPTRQPSTEAPTDRRPRSSEESPPEPDDPGEVGGTDRQKALLSPVLVGGASTGIVGAGAVLLAGTSPVAAALAVGASWVAGACLGWWYGSRSG